MERNQHIASTVCPKRNTGTLDCRARRRTRIQNGTARIVPVRGNSARACTFCSFSRELQMAQTNVFFDPDEPGFIVKRVIDAKIRLAPTQTDYIPWQILS